MEDCCTSAGTRRRRCACRRSSGFSRRPAGVSGGLEPVAASWRLDVFQRYAPVLAPATFASPARPTCGVTDTISSTERVRLKPKRAAPYMNEAFAAILGGFTVVATALSLLRSKVWWIRIWDFPRVQIATLGIVALALWVGTGPWRDGANT